MRVKIVNVRSVGGFDFGEFLGLYVDNGCDRCGSDTALAVVRRDGFGLMVSLHHPSIVSAVTPSEENNYRS